MLDVPVLVAASVGGGEWAATANHWDVEALPSNRLVNFEPRLQRSDFDAGGPHQCCEGINVGSGRLNVLDAQRLFRKLNSLHRHYLVVELFANRKRRNHILLKLSPCRAGTCFRLGDGPAPLS